MNTSASLYKLIEPVVREYYGLEEKKHTPIYSSIFETETTDEAIFEIQEVGGPGPMSYKAESSVMATRDIVVGYTKRFQAATFASAIQLTLEAAEDVRYDAVSSAASSLGRSTVITPELLAADFLDNGFSSSFPVAGDNLSLYNSSHTIPQGGTFSNTLATPYALGEIGVEQVMQNLATLPWTDGMVYPLEIRKLVVHPSKGPQAWKLANTQLQTGGANNDRSYIAGKLEVVVDPYLSKTTPYHFLTDCPQKLFWKWRIKPQFMRDNEQLKTIALWMTRFRAAWGVKNARAAYGVNATG